MNVSRTKKIILKVMIYTLLTLLFAIFVFPIFYAFMSSFKENRELLVGTSLLPKEFRIDNYINAWKIAKFSTYTWNSAWYSSVFVAISVLTSSVCGYVFARGEFRGKKVIFALFTSLMFITLGTSSLYPTLQILKLFHLNNSLYGLLIKHFFEIQVSNVFLVRGYIDTLPKELDEAAIIDGCNFAQIFVRIIFPLLKPIIATVAIFSFTGAWNDYLMPMIVTMSNPAQRTLSVGMIALKGTSDAATSWNLLMAGSMISALPIIIVFLVFNKYFIKGLASGAVKG